MACPFIPAEKALAAQDGDIEGFDVTVTGTIDGGDLKVVVNNFAITGGADKADSQSYTVKIGSVEKTSIDGTVDGVPEQTFTNDDITAAGTYTVEAWRTSGTEQNPRITKAITVPQMTDLQDEWGRADITYSVPEDNYGRYITTLADQMVVSSITDVFGNRLTAADYDVLYFDNSGDIVSDQVGTAGWGSYPTTEGTYTIMVLKAGQAGMPEAASGQNIATYKPYANQTQQFTISRNAENSLEGVYAYEGTDKDDTSFKFNGAAMNVNFAIGDTQLTDTGRYAINWTTSSTKITVGQSSGVTPAINTSQVTDAGTYTATIWDNQTGAKATVEVVVDPIDLDADTVAIPTVNNDSGYKSFDASYITVNGKKLATGYSGSNGTISYTATQLDDQTGTTYMPDLANDGDTLGVYTFEISAASVSGGNTNVVGGPIEVTGCVVDNVVKFYYGGTKAANEVTYGNGTTQPYALNNRTFVTANGEAFSPAQLKAIVETTNAEADFIYSVTKDGQPVSTYTEPGEYVVTLDPKLTDNFASTGHQVVSFKVVDRDPANYSVFAQVDGKSLNETFPYTGKAYVPTVAVVDEDGTKAVEGTDYTVSYELHSTGEAVESMVDAGAYDIVVTFADERVADQKVAFEISRAEVATVKADQGVYAYTGEVIAPTFTGNTKADGTGLSVALNADNAVITYKKSLKTDADGNTNWTGTSGTDYATVSARDLSEEGTYQATVSVPATNKNFKDANPVATAVFEISKTAKYADVDANQWYAQFVYTAASEGFGYMNGIPGTNLFMPEASITRAQTAQVLFNMAGGVSETGYYPTAFSDVNGWAWYAQPIAWASQASIVTGIGDTGTFAPDENVTREQAATMLYRYVKAQGKDASAAADLSQYTDGASVSDWAAEAMSWAVDADVFGVGTDVLRPQDTLTRAEMAAIAVRVQPDGAIEAL